MLFFLGLILKHNFYFIMPHFQEKTAINFYYFSLWQIFHSVGMKTLKNFSSSLSSNIASLFVVALILNQVSQSQGFINKLELIAKLVRFLILID